MWAIYFVLTDAIKRRFIAELREFWKFHPKYRDDLVNNIQGKFSFKERPQHGIIVKTGAGNRVDLSADNFMGVIESYVLLTRVKNKPGIAIEWIREDSHAIQRNGGRFPSAPGVYFIEIGPDNTFFVDPLLDVYREGVSMADSSTGQLLKSPLPGTLSLFEMPSGFKLFEGVNYTLTLGGDGKPTGEIILTDPLSSGRWLQADYRHPEESIGPIQYRELHADNKAIPGVVLAFGRRGEPGDQLAVVVQAIRSPAYLEYGGKWDLTLDIDIMSRDVFAQQEIADNTAIYLWGILRSRLSHQGIEVTDVSMGGESEEIYDENADDHFYNASLSVTVQTEWSIHVPLDTWIRQVAPLTAAQAREVAGLTDDELIGEEGNIKGFEALGIESIRDPFWSGRRGTFEVIR